ncbi:MAG: aldehyde dehydrogenase family protein [Acidobacteria bacterium]|nr:aldehyde dehydrogenase family protein [Acidobacteriota bacterium]
MPEPLLARPFIHGQSRATRDVAEVRSPYSGEVVTRCERGGPTEIAEALGSAHEAFETTRRLAPWERAGILSRIAAEVAKRRDEFAGMLVREAGKPVKAARLEAERTVHTFEVAAEEAKRQGGEVLPLDTVPWGAGHFGITRRFPIGLVAGITPFNFPLNLTAHKIAPAIAAGNSIVIKPASQTPTPACALAEIAFAAGAPPGAVNVVPARSTDVAAFVTDPRVKMLTFTGSPAVGWDLKARAGKKKVALELGGNAAVVVTASADLAYAVERIVAGGFGYAGQSCISVQRVLVDRKVERAFLELLLPKVKALNVGDPQDEATDVGPLISKQEAERAEAWVREAVSGGARLLAGGEREGAILKPTVLTGTKPDMRVNCQEIFAPVVTVTAYDDFAAALNTANDSPFGLQAGVFTRDAEEAWRAFETLEVGGVMINDVSTYRVDHMPYGGVKDSGVGREGLRYAIEEMTEPRLMVWNRRS